MNTKALFLLLSIVTLLPVAMFAEDDLIGNYAITFHKKGDDPQHTVWMQKQQRDYELYRSGKILVAGIFQDTAQETITILQPMHRSEAERIMNEDPVVKAGLWTADMRFFSCYAPEDGGARGEVALLWCRGGSIA